MPRTSKGKKRKSPVKNGPRKRLKHDKICAKSTAELEKVPEDSSSEREEGEKTDDIDELLEENASKNNLTAINVKSIIHVSN